MMGCPIDRDMRMANVICVSVLLLMMTASYAIADDDGKAAASRQEIRLWLAELERRPPGSDVSIAVPGGQAESAHGQSASVAKENREAFPDKKSIRPGSTDADKISVDFFKIDLHNVFRLLGQVSGKNIVVDEKVNGTLTLALKDVPWIFVLEVIKNLKGLESIERNNTIMIYPSSKKITWAGDAVAAGTLDLEPSAPIFEEISGHQGMEDNLSINSRESAGTPIEQIVRAQEMIQKGMEAELHGLYDEALNFYKNASELWQDNSSLSKKVAALALKQGDEITALNFGKRALKAVPEDGEAATVVAVASARMGKTDEAEVYFERALNTETLSRETLYNYAVFAFSQGRYRDALSTINKMEANFPLTVDVMMLKAQTYEGMKNLEKAISEYQVILNAGKGVPPSAVQYARCRLDALSNKEGTVQ